jgi:hypothetical protein
MKRVGLWAVMGIGLFLTVGLLAVESGYAEEKEHEPTCTLKTLKGRYLFGGVTTLLPPALGVTQPSLSSAAGYHIYNGDGTGTDVVTVRINGETVLENFVTPTSYTINPDCTGTVTVTNGPSFGLFTAPSGEELIIIGTDPGDTGVLGPSRRVSRR